jgi:hypothetical protein
MDSNEIEDTMKSWPLAGLLLCAALASLWAGPGTAAQQPDPGAVITAERTPELGVGKMNHGVSSESR